jgi:alkylation response protein AidB-like acyl-CoA dehydrogenase
MAFSFSDEQEAFRGIVKRFMDERAASTEVRRLMASDLGYDANVWRQLSQELGVTGIQIPEEYGGQGFGFVELGIVLEEMGRALYCGPYFSTTVLAANAIMNAGSRGDKEQYLPAIAAGELFASLAFCEPSGRWDVESVTTTAAPADGAFKLSGQKRFVLDGMLAQQFVVAARAPGSHGKDGISLFMVAADARGLERRAVRALDPTRKLAELDLHDVVATPLGEIGAGAQALEDTLMQAAVALASESVGGAQAMLNAAVDYTLMRVQFGRLVGSFQAIKHQCAELLLDVELAKSAAYQAANAASDADADQRVVASIAKAASSDSFMGAAIRCIQLHGGIGFTWEQDTHLWFKRAKSSEVFLGTPTYHREIVVANWA